MFIKRLQNNEILDALHLVWEVFVEETAPSYSPEGVEEFRSFIKLDQVMSKVQSQELIFWGAFEGPELCGVTAIRSDGHISLLFVRKQWQHRGMARGLVAAASQHCTAERGILRMTVNAAPQSVMVYRHFGFHETAPQQTVNGIVFVPMERIASPGDVRPPVREKHNKGLIIGLSIGGVVLILLILFGLIFAKLVTSAVVSREVEERQEEENDSWDDNDGWDDYDEYEDPEDGEEADPGEQEQGIEAIPCYVGENLPYTIEDKIYTYRSVGQGNEYPMEFEIHYPQLAGLEGGKMDEINTMLKECAMSTVNSLYLEPSEELKESMLQEENPFLASQVTYKVSYAGKDFISVVFSDHYFAGNYAGEFQDLRTRNIRLSDGTRYETADIVELDSAFMEDWLKRMKKESPNSYALEELTMEQFQKILGGEILENRYYDNFFVDAEGIEIGMTFHFNNSQRMERGWVTAPYTMEETKTYRKDNDFWKLVQ